MATGLLDVMAERDRGNNRRIIRTAVGLGAVALVIYLIFIGSGVLGAGQ